MYLCKEDCKKFKAEKSFDGKSRYEAGQKRCNVCAVFLNYNGVRCPCCGCKLRTNPRSTKLRRSMLIHKESIMKKSHGNMSAYTSEIWFHVDNTLKI